ncbi:MAG: SH3 domain-containing protein [Caldilineaceae bacterium]|nr:SH3 domain-containing protein [Caldilineaceae bacterium]
MNHLPDPYVHLRQLLRRAWIGIVGLVFALLLINRGSMLLAAPLHQTVPPPTPTSITEPVPTATAIPNDDNDDDDDDDDNDDDDDDNNSPAPTNTPVPQAEQPTAVPQPEQPTAVPQMAQPTAVPLAPAVEGPTGTIIVDRLNVRQGPGTNYAVIGTLTNGTIATILSRNEVGDWWHVCCIGNTTQAGWVAAQYVQANFDLGQASTLIPVDSTLAAAAIPTVTPTVEPSLVPTTTVSADLAVQVQQVPLYAWPGATLTLAYQIENRGDVAATNLELRNELPAELSFVNIAGLAAGEFMTETTTAGRTVVAVRWPELAVGADLTVNLQVQVAEQLGNGMVLDNLTVTSAENAEAITTGISIGMPPVNLPDFR